ncbi:MAG: hypothetical protein HY000_33535 [Planctomycetes bacterium]|nr:hypothetical protein [Planctomycetota bacterium]
MGIDYLDIRFRLQKCFGINTCNDENWFLFHTAGMLHDFVWQKLQGKQPACPDTHALGRKVQQAIKGLKGFGRHRSWLPAWSLEKLIPADNRREHWQQLSQALECPLPPLIEEPEVATPRVPAECRTLTDLVFWILKHHPESAPLLREERIEPPPPGAESWTEEEVWQAVRSILCDVLAVKPEEVTREAHLVNDLGMQ